jgi:hypothetical protein
MKLSKKALSLKRAMIVAFAEKQSMTIDKAIKIAKTEVKDPYAQTYLQAIPNAIEQFGYEGFTTQIAYAFANTSTWRGENARQVKAFVKSWLKYHQRTLLKTV